MQNNTDMRTILENVYLDWFNNYASVNTFAEHNQITPKQAEALLTLAKDVYYTAAPDA